MFNGGSWFDIDEVTLLLRQTRSSRCGIDREVRFRDAAGRTSSVTQHQFVAMHMPHVGASVARQHPAESPAVVLVAHATLLLIALLTILVNPFSLVLLLPAAALWPLARPGRWTRSLLPVWSGLAVVGVALLYIGLRLGLGLTVWWYFFLLLENRTVPAAPIVLGIALVATTALLGRELHVHTAPRPEAEAGGRGRGRRRPRPPASDVSPPSARPSGTAGGSED